MSSKKYIPDPEDATLFRSHVKGATPIKQDRVVHAGKKIKPTPAKRAISENSLGNNEQIPVHSASTSVNANSQLFYAKSGLQPRAVKQLKQGKTQIEGRLDLHGLTVEKAQPELMSFITDCQQSQIRCVIVVHGRGLRSPGGIAVLKQNVDSWLRHHPAVLAFSSCVPNDGGLGSVYVLLKQLK